MSFHRCHRYVLLIAAWVVLFAAAILLAPLSSVYAQGQSTVTIDSQAIDAYLSSQIAANHIPGLSVAIVQGDQIAFLRGYGEAAPGKPVTPQTQFYLGSLTKSFTALAVMQLVEQGKLELDAPVQRYLPWFKVADVDASAKITLRNLLNQTSGLSEAGDPSASEYAPTLFKQVQAMQNVRPTAPVGTQFQYYNQNYRVLGLVVEQVTGQRYADYLRDHVFTPLGMRLTTAEGPSAAPNLAQNYSMAFGYPLPRQQAFRPGALPSGYMISSGEDMAHYMIAQLNQVAYAGQSLVQPESLTLMHTPPAGINSQYGMGWMTFEDPEYGTVTYHDGALENTYAMVILLPDQKLGIAALINQGGLIRQVTGNQSITSGLADLLMGKHPKPAAFSWVGWLLLAIVALDLLNHLRLFWRLPGWAANDAQKPGARRWVWAALGLFIPLALLIGLPPLLNILMNGQISSWLSMWQTMLDLLPDLATWIFIGLSLTVVRGLIKMGILVLNPRG